MGKSQGSSCLSFTGEGNPRDPESLVTPSLPKLSVVGRNAISSNDGEMAFALQPGIFTYNLQEPRTTVQ